MSAPNLHTLNISIEGVPTNEKMVCIADYLLILHWGLGGKHHSVMATIE